MSKPLAFFLMLVIVVAGQMIALSIHLKKTEMLLFPILGVRKNFGSLHVFLSEKMENF